jgi:hypothetical protein
MPAPRCRYRLPAMGLTAGFMSRKRLADTLMAARRRHSAGLITDDYDADDVLIVAMRLAHTFRDKAALPMSAWRRACRRDGALITISVERGTLDVARQAGDAVINVDTAARHNRRLPGSATPRLATCFQHDAAAPILPSLIESGVAIEYRGALVMSRVKLRRLYVRVSR